MQQLNKLERYEFRLPLPVRPNGCYRRLAGAALAFAITVAYSSVSFSAPHSGLCSTARLSLTPHSGLCSTARLSLTPHSGVPPTARLCSATLTLVPFDKLIGWDRDNLRDALTSFRRSCVRILSQNAAPQKSPQAYFGGTIQEWASVCKKATSAQAPRSFFEKNFTALKLYNPTNNAGLFTGYYEPEAPGSLQKTSVYTVPLYRSPPDPVHFSLTRQQIEQGALHNKNLELIWLKDRIDAYFIHIQGSARIKLTDGKIMRVRFAAKNNHPYKSIGAVLLAQGQISREDISMQTVKSWLRTHKNANDQILWSNPSYIFFDELKDHDPTLGSIGASDVALTPLRSLAIDPKFWAYGTPIWLSLKNISGQGHDFRHLLIAQDTGSAIKGMKRGDVYWGWGQQAERMAGSLKSPGDMVILLPHSIARRLMKQQ